MDVADTAVDGADVAAGCGVSVAGGASVTVTLEGRVASSDTDAGAFNRTGRL